MGGLIQGLRNNAVNFKIARILYSLLPMDTDMNYEKLKAMPTADLIDLYNDLEQQQVKRMKTRAEAERRTTEALKKAGKWEDPDTGPVPYSPAQVEPGDEPGGVPAPGVKKRGGKKAEQVDEQPAAPAATKKATKKGKAGAAAEQPKLSEKEKAAIRKNLGADTTVADEKPAKGKGKKDAAAAKPAKAAKKDKGDKKRGAPVKNQTFTLVGEKDKKRNPKGLKIQPSSARNIVLMHLQAKKVPQTREQIEKAFEGTDTNVGSSLYFLVKHNFITAKDNE